MKRLGVLVSLSAEAGALAPPAELPLGRAALTLTGWGLELVFVEPEALRLAGRQLVGQGFSALDAHSWKGSTRPLAAVYNRYPAAGQPAAFAQAAALLAGSGVPWGNGPRLSALCTDKLRTGQRLALCALPYPETVSSAAEALERLPHWRALFAKPRYGSLGEGVFRLELRGPEPTIEPDPGWGRLDWPSARLWLGQLAAAEPYLFQKAVPQLLPELRGCSLRSLVQKDLAGCWRTTGRVARVSPTDPIANVARGSRVWSLDELCQASGLEPKALLSRLDQLDAAVAEALEAEPEAGRAAALELGIDYALDPVHGPVLLEVNGKPLGRFTELARRGLAGDLHGRALLAPLLLLDALSPPAVLGPAAAEEILRRWPD